MQARQQLVSRIRELALADETVAEIMHKILETEPINSEDPEQAGLMRLYFELWAAAEEAIICEIVK